MNVPVSDCQISACLSVIKVFFYFYYSSILLQAFRNYYMYIHNNFLFFHSTILNINDYLMLLMRCLYVHSNWSLISLVYLLSVNDQIFTERRINRTIVGESKGRPLIRSV